MIWRSHNLYRYYCRTLTRRLSNGVTTRAITVRANTILNAMPITITITITNCSRRPRRARDAVRLSSFALCGRRCRVRQLTIKDRDKHNTHTHTHTHTRIHAHTHRCIQTQNHIHTTHTHTHTYRHRRIRTHSHTHTHSHTYRHKHTHTHTNRHGHHHGFVFGGQGSQVVGMGADIVREFPTAKYVYDEVDEALQYRLSTLQFEGLQVGVGTGRAHYTVYRSLLSLSLYYLSLSLYYLSLSLSLCYLSLFYLSLSLSLLSLSLFIYLSIRRCLSLSFFLSVCLSVLVEYVLMNCIVLERTLSN